MSWWQDFLVFFGWENKVVKGRPLEEGERLCAATRHATFCQDDCLRGCRSPEKEKSMAWPPQGWIRTGSGLGPDQFGGPGALEIALERAVQTLVKELKTGD